MTRRGSTVPVHAALASPLVRLTVFPVFALAAIFALAVLDASRAHAAGALEAVTQGAASNLGPLASTLNTSVVVAAPLTVDDAAPRGDELALRVAALVAGRLGSGVRAHPQTAQLGTARAIAGRASALVYVQTAIAQGDLRTTIDVYPPMANAWDRIRNPLPSPTGHAFATAKIDAEVRAFLAPLLLESATVDRAHHDEGDVLAAACGDVDGDGGNELVLVSSGRVAVGRIRGGRFVPEPSAGAFDGAPVDCAVRRDPRPTMAVPAPRFDAFGAASVPDALGHARIVVAVREPSGRVRLKAGDATSASDALFGAQLAVGDLDQDGQPDVVTSAALSYAGAPGGRPEDAIDVATWTPGAAATGSPSDLRPRLHLPAPGGVRALAMCPPEEHGEPALVAVVGSEVWLIRAAVQR